MFPECLPLLRLFVSCTQKYRKTRNAVFGESLMAKGGLALKRWRITSLRVAQACADKKDDSLTDFLVDGLYALVFQPDIVLLKARYEAPINKD